MRNKYILEKQHEFDLFISSLAYYEDLAKALLGITDFKFSEMEINQMQTKCKEYFNRKNNPDADVNLFEKIFTAYIGEAFMHYHPGKWSLSTRKNDPAFGKPIIIDWTPPGRVWVRICPYEWMAAIKESTFEGKLSDVITWQFNL